MKILVTGGSGFIGSNLILELSKNNEIISIDKTNPILKAVKNITFIKGDIRDKKIFDDIPEVDQIYHFASVVGVDYVSLNPMETIETEILGIMNVINFAKYNDVKKILYSSSSSVYGDFKEHNQDSNELSPLSSYGKSKLFAEHYLSKVKKKYGIDYTILRYFNVYGEFQQEKMVIARFMNAALKNENLRVFGDGMQTRDFTFIEDVVRITINVMNADKTNSKIIDVGTGKQITMNNLASEILSLMPSSTSKLINVQEPSHRKKYEIRQRYCNTTKLNQLGYFCKTQLSEGLIATLNLTEYNK